jgi:hypothetical protein
MVKLRRSNLLQRVSRHSIKSPTAGAAAIFAVAVKIGIATYARRRFLATNVEKTDYPTIMIFKVEATRCIVDIALTTRL